jgi:hypothetical protein
MTALISCDWCRDLGPTIKGASRWTGIPITIVSSSLLVRVHILWVNNHRTKIAIACFGRGWLYNLALEYAQDTLHWTLFTHWIRVGLSREYLGGVHLS